MYKKWIEIWRKVDGYLQIKMKYKWKRKQRMGIGKIICYEGNLEYTNDRMIFIIEDHPIIC